MRNSVSKTSPAGSRSDPPAQTAISKAMAGGAASQFRLWMTNSRAVVMLSVFASRPSAGRDQYAPSRVVRHSPYGVAETLRRIELAVSEQGLSVMARFGDERQPVIVLSSSVGGTPVLMSEGDVHPDIPLSVQIRSSFFGGADVVMMCPSSVPETDWCDLPDSVIQDIVSLPQLVETALMS
jgi:uncharacterized protein (DUF302 family)